MQFCELSLVLRERVELDKLVKDEADVLHLHLLPDGLQNDHVLVLANSPLLVHELAQLSRVGVVQKQRRWQLVSQDDADPVPDSDQVQRVHFEAEESLVDRVFLDCEADVAHDADDKLQARLRLGHLAIRRSLHLREGLLLGPALAVRGSLVLGLPVLDVILDEDPNAFVVRVLWSIVGHDLDHLGPVASVEAHDRVHKLP
mmetsp:Transcript_81414/g.239115  ORF Transcript_81414/g.239115 Transcript_81414/m.239115 type:complete len:201 (+) Transcript_81414:309-911(+)